MQSISIRALALALPLVAQAAPYIASLTGDQFVQLMTRPDPPTQHDYGRRERAYSYLDGARDAGEGRTWCDVHQLKTPDMAYEIADEISRLPAADRKNRAATLILQVLHMKYPCPAGRSS
jgi:hypothetical protein